MKIISDWIDALKGRRELDVKLLPSQGIFYKKDFKIWIKKVKREDILEYEKLYTNDITVVLVLIKKIVAKYTSLSADYIFDDIKSSDITFIFLEIVRLSTDKEIKIDYYNDVVGAQEIIEFKPDNFNYFKVPEKLRKTFNDESKEYLIDGYRFSIPSIGIET